MILAGLVCLGLCYGAGLLRIHRLHRSFPAAAPWAMAAALLSLAGALLGPLDDLADASLYWHMLQHLLIINVSALVFICAAPVRLMLAALPTRAARAVAAVMKSAVVQAMSSPPAALLQFIMVLYVGHFSPLYDAALGDERIHALEHILFFVSAALYWNSIFEIAPVAHRYGYPLRLLSLFMALPITGFLGFMMYVARHPWYAHYAHEAGALSDQMAAGALMWIAGGGSLFLALLFLAAQWSREERAVPEHLILPTVRVVS